MTGTVDIPDQTHQVRRLICPYGIHKMLSTCAPGRSACKIFNLLFGCHYVNIIVPWSTRGSPSGAFAQVIFEPFPGQSSTALRRLRRRLPRSRDLSPWQVSHNCPGTVFACRSRGADIYNPCKHLCRQGCLHGLIFLEIKISSSGAEYCG